VPPDLVPVEIALTACVKLAVGPSWLLDVILMVKHRNRSPILCPFHSK